MRNRNPKGLWEEVRAFMGWVEEDDDQNEQAQDPALLFHLCFTAPLVITLLSVARRMAAS